jgi:adenylylsulfate kinase-like enzyme
MRYEGSRRRFKHASKPLPFHIAVNGLAGSGKSYVISIIEQMLTDFCISESAVRNRPRRRKGLLKMTHTGKAALNILGWTIHTALGMVKFRFV